MAGLLLCLLRLLFFCVKTEAACQSVEAILNLDGGSVYKSSCDSIFSDGHLINFTTRVLSGDGVITLISSAADCSKELSNVYYYRGSCQTPTLNCTGSKYTTAAPVCLIVYNPSTSKQQLYVKVAFMMPEIVDPLLPNQFHLFNTGQYGGVPGEDINVTGAWALSTGQGIIIDIVDDGLLITHQDLEDRVRVDLSYDYQDNDNSPLGLSTDGHGTACAGLAAAGGGNYICGRGVAPKAYISAHRILYSGATSIDIQAGLYDTQHGGSDIDISSNSWGPFGCDEKTGCEFYVEDPIVLDALAEGITYGRGGKGRVYVFAGGNEGDIGGDVNQYPICKLRSVICVVGSTYKGTKTFYSNPGTALLVNAPTSGAPIGDGHINWPGMTTLSVYSEKACMDSFGGTSGATPVVAGVIALILQVRPQCTWRDVQQILIHSAYQNDANSTTWLTNGAGWRYSRWYGFGRVDAYSAVTLAKTWRLVEQEQEWDSGFVTTNICLPDASVANVHESISMFSVEESGITSLETVAISVNIEHQIIGDIRILVTSPQNTTVLVVNETHNIQQNLYNYTFYIRSFYGERANGNWSLHVVDATVNGADGHLKSWKLTLWGTGPGCHNATPCTEQPRHFSEKAWGVCRGDLLFYLSLEIAIPIAVGATMVLVLAWCCIKCRKYRQKRGETEKLLHKTPEKKRRKRHHSPSRSRSQIRQLRGAADSPSPSKLPSSHATVPGSPSSPQHGNNSRNSSGVGDSPPSKVTASPSHLSVTD